MVALIKGRKREQGRRKREEVRRKREEFL